MSRNTTKCHNIFTIPSFSAVVSFDLIYYYLFYRNVISIIFSSKILDDKLLLILKFQMTSRDEQYILNKLKSIKVTTIVFTYSHNKCYNIFTKHLFSMWLVTILYFLILFQFIRKRHFNNCEICYTNITIPLFLVVISSSMIFYFDL